TLLFFPEEPGTFIELTSGHPGGIAPLVADKPVLLSNLVRESSAFRDARDAADRIARKGGELVSSRGMGTISLGTGIVEWTHDGRHHRAPILTRPVSLRRLGRDYEVLLKGQNHVNASLVRALANQFGVRLVPRELLEVAKGTDSFLPQPVFDHVRGALSNIPGATVSARVVVSSFGDVADALVFDAATADLSHPALRALAGDDRAADALRRAHGGPGLVGTGEPSSDSDAEPGASRATAPGASETGDTDATVATTASGTSAFAAAAHANDPDAALASGAGLTSPDRRDPTTDRLLLDADSEQERVVDAIVGGRSLVVNAMPGAGLTQTVVNTIGSLVGEGRRVLVVSPRSASLQAIRQRLRAVGLDGLTVTPRTLRRDMIAGISRNERAERPQLTDLNDALVRLRHVLADYRAALQRVDPETRVNVVTALDELSSLELTETPPATTSRLERDAIVRLAAGRDEIAAQLREVGRLGEFKYGPDDSPWYGVAFESMEDANLAQQTATELSDGRLWDVVVEARELVGRTRLRPAATFAELGIYLRLLLDVRETLDRFRPEVFDRSLADLIVATGPRRDTAEMNSSRRRQLKQLAREYVRPGLSVGDLHEALQLVQRQRILWQRYSTDGSTPTVPTGIAEVRARYREVAELVRIIDEPLVEAGATPLTDMPLDELAGRLDQLAAESEVLHNIVERLRITEKLRELGLEPLLTDLADRHVAADDLAAELELAWWQSALEDALERDKALLAANTRTLARLESDFRTVDQAHTDSGAARLRWQLAEEWRVAIVDHADEAEALRAMLRSPGVSPTRLAREAGNVSRPIAKVWLASPGDVPLIASGIDFDTAVLLDAASVSTAEAIGAIRRADQLVAFGDPVTQLPSPFSIAVRGDVELDHVDETPAQLEARADDSIFSRLASLLPEYRLTHSYRAGGEDLAELVNRRFYGGEIRSMPWAGTFLGHPSLSYVFVEGGTGMPDQATGAVESTDAEVSRVVELVVDHALHRPRESLMVVTASPRHAARVQQAVYSAVSKRQDLAPFFTQERGEPFLSTTIDQATAQSRDRVIFSIGFGRTPHGKVLSNFGVLGTPRGEHALAVAMTRARRSLVIVSCVRPSELDPARFTPGTLALAQVLGEAETRDLVTRGGDVHEHPMLLDLARRLEVLGMRVELDYRGRIPLAAAYGGRAIAVDTDALDAEVAGDGDPTLRESLRLRPELLKRLGWYYLRVHSFELFASPEVIAERIAVALRVPLPGDAAELPASPRTERAAELTEGRELDADAPARSAAAAADLAMGRTLPAAPMSSQDGAETIVQRSPDAAVETGAAATDGAASDSADAGVATGAAAHVAESAAPELDGETTAGVTERV
ncbi:MAG: DEAD/DEAH box helicase, partial [Pseudoclavibacter sp.]